MFVSFGHFDLPFCFEFAAFALRTFRNSSFGFFLALKHFCRSVIK
ncbi:MAG: hypothetical protein [Olavius algarvensis Delta 4 endosymbiont]|nr:MAG: hypothetical protein [Olavius algarvensis Delta 4 endosymbiont]